MFAQCLLDRVNGVLSRSIRTLSFGKWYAGHLVVHNY